MPKTKTSDVVLLDFKKIHGEKYDYSKAVYVNSKVKVLVICPDHGPFEVTPNHHLKGVGCRKCHFSSTMISKEEFIRRAISLFGNIYDYSKSELQHGSTGIVSIFCTLHSLNFQQEARAHMQGHSGCPGCLSLKLSGTKNTRGIIKSQSTLNDEFISRAQAIHGMKYDYSDFVYVSSATKSKIICKVHGPFYQSPSNHLRESNCPICSKESSLSETFKEECKMRSVNYHRALKRRQAGLSTEKVFKREYIRSDRKIQEIIVRGKIYPNLKSAMRELSPPATAKTISRWLRNGMSTEAAFERIPNPGYEDGIIYLITDTTNNKMYIGLTIQTIERRWKYHIEQANANYIKSDFSLHSAIRLKGTNNFTIEQIDSGKTKFDLEQKERSWIEKLNTISPSGYNIASGGVIGGSNSKPTIVDNIKFKSVKEAAAYIGRTRAISEGAAKKRLIKNRIDVKTPSKPGETYVFSKTYKAWSNIVHSSINPNSKDYIAGITYYGPWRDFKNFKMDVGEPPEENMVHKRLDQDKGFYPDNCKWMTKKEAGKINAEWMKRYGLLTGRTRKTS